MDRAAALGADLSSVDVTARWSDEGFWYPWSCTLTAAGYSFALSESVEANLGYRRSGRAGRRADDILVI